MIRINQITDKVASYIDNPDLDLIQRAYVFSAQAHDGVVRRSGEPYISHPMNVAYLLAEMQLDEATVAAGLLHDTVEDTQASVDEIEEFFGSDVADIVDGVTKISQMDFESKAVQQAENIRKLILAMAEDIRVLMVKLADRLHNMRTLEFMKPVKQRLIAQETQDIYAPLANRLGLHRVKTELEDLCLRYLKPDVFDQLSQAVSEHRASGEPYIDKVIDLINDMLKKNKIKGRVYGRTKHLHSIHVKMEQQGLTFDEIYDLIAFRIILESVKDCYAVLGLIHSIWRPVPGRFKDYISIPKANMYQSLHSTVIGPDGERIEVQIRTEEMNRIAEYGVAAHWQYKEVGKGSKRARSADTRDAERYTWLRQIMDWQRELSDPREFMASLRLEMFQEEVYVFTPSGDIKELPEGATPVDFAYAIHSEVGDKCAGAKVNGRIVPLHSPLKNGDSVEIITDKNRMPSRDWLKFVKTAKARTRIKQYIRTVERERAIALGRELLEKEGRRLGINVQKAIKDGDFIKLVEGFNCGSVDDLLTQVGFSRFTPRKVVKKLYSVIHGESMDLRKVRDKEEESAPAPDPKKKPKTDGLQISGVDNVLVRFASCCNPLPGEPIIGYITRGRGVTVHRIDCHNVKNFEEERLVGVNWEGVEEKPYPAKIKIKCLNKTGMLGKICSMLAEQNVNIDSGSFESKVDGTSVLEFTVEVKDLDQLYSALSKVKALKAVQEALRVS
ncbi:MAG: bifunctional (p)ppGpp synthetase/guanosine-3',5'-bis(diphosphate) 3'-pyrophosphohydrolase [Pseudodesulfovibrio sp.]|uniref:RelA/SpoT family protein n=1 Tax=Pseudodesulfovibrio aespoeensis (strain ATCC 700646 / DSM 10631 / Aspo-2) TaxID=643562 RepID=E6VS34_PSEA9|nr:MULTISPECIES: bifunctional (p)ppGpp synthetase/guanosine-3',5'-bis(diphosphate) 3'-pyrophosphohydrolase [Pseudodesulfovibrio]MBU4379242.1 bifunctional (p)ppGpp synthetase/guanosine-3',5'-bis(diphosphate) 3'-pyrophosphohydrolase [Pseudomonadota bacterium]ADU63079.1 RelA/SpoT family protein [Pseudodesulfovibrio aespoeensis Aspo-2]MBU4474145.1 bifunctional (p)ppGpp synthetase/guanosine-3',5'-bis(diphosphate) 3'-pyrophosphohydrolase [Pseudomonadota bacterium]MBU4516787.1 bifunctional (p)ppGpp sy